MQRQRYFFFRQCNLMVEGGGRGWSGYIALHVHVYWTVLNEEGCHKSTHKNILQPFLKLQSQMNFQPTMPWWQRTHGCLK